MQQTRAIILWMKTTAGVMGASAMPEPRLQQMAMTLGRQIAARGAVLITGATTGMPLAAAQGAFESGGEVIGFSPASNEQEHRQMGMPFDFHTLVLYTGLGYNGRNLLNVRSSSVLFFAGGSMGTLNEFTIAYDENKIMGVLEGTGGFCDNMREWIRCLSKPHNRSVIHYSSDPVELVKSVFSALNAPGR